MRIDPDKLARNVAPHVITARKFVKHVGPQVIRPAQVMWNQIIGVIFLVFALPALSKAWTYYQTLGTEAQSFGRLCFALPFGLLMLFFGIGSFLRARRLAKLIA